MGVSVFRVSGDRVPSWLPVALSRCGGILHLSPAHESGQHLLDSEMQLLATSDENVLGRRAEAILKWNQASAGKSQALNVRVAQGVKVTWGFKRANEDEGHPPGNTKKEQDAIKGWKAFFLYLNRFPRVTTLLLLKNPWRQAPKSHENLSHPDW